MLPVREMVSYSRAIPIDLHPVDKVADVLRRKGKKFNETIARGQDAEVTPALRRCSIYKRSGKGFQMGSEKLQAVDLVRASLVSGSLE